MTLWQVSGANAYRVHHLHLYASVNCWDNLRKMFGKKLQMRYLQGYQKVWNPPSL